MVLGIWGEDGATEGWGKVGFIEKGGGRDRRVGEVTEGKGGGEKGGRVYIGVRS